MTKSWAVVSALVLAFCLAAEALGYPIILSVLKIFSGWLEAVPGPTAEWASILAAWGWPLSALLIAYLLKRPLRIAAHHLAKRFEKDRIKVGGLLEIDAATSLIPLNDAARDVKVIEGMWEFVGASDEAWDQLLTWISTRVAPNVEVEDFLTERIFAPERELAYTELVEGK